MSLLRTIVLIARHPVAREVMWSVLAVFGVGLIDRPRREGGKRNR